MFRKKESIPQNVLNFLMECTATKVVEVKRTADLMLVDECNEMNKRILQYIRPVVPTTQVKKRKRGVVIRVFVDELTLGNYVVGTRIYFWQEMGVFKRRHWITADDTENMVTSLKGLPESTWVSPYEFQPAKRAEKIRLKYKQMINVKEYIYIF